MRRFLTAFVALFPALGMAQDVHDALEAGDLICEI